jgi:hypothetical protein
MNNDRRSFIRNAALGVSAAVTGSGAVAATTAELTGDDTTAIRALQRRYFTLLQQGNERDLAALCVSNGGKVHDSAVLDVRIDDEHIDLAQDRVGATARWDARVLLGAALAGNSTLEQMARAQGQSERQWQERGIYTARYVKVGSEWKIETLQYQKA